MHDNTLTSFTTTSKDGTQLHGHYQMPHTAPVAVIYFIHGLGGHSGRFQQPASLLAKNSIASIGIDLRGNGRSEGKRGYTESLDKYVEDIDACIKYSQHLFPTHLPKLMMGNSMGGAIALYYSMKHKAIFSGVILTAPWIRLTTPISRVKLAFMAILNKIAPTITFSSKVRPPQKPDEDQQKQAVENDTLIHKQITPRLLMIMHHLGNLLLKKADCYLPTLVLHSKNDPITAYESSLELCNKHKLSCKLVSLEDPSHEVPFEENNAVFKEVQRHINKIRMAHEQLQD
ncbi:alpha/beta fold hydrolase [Saccharicrinis fermentans]|uniref:Phospholipase YtpA n=1 Tax=Saccharicrinis fermentans DSM 9555 = JCM 21142 TaxID=869213 RepID=W7YGT3_9BACT|nr:alpha/beta fold hydrolase [Saccharicrinis fermentans]GAF03596.1 phospholipase YtpA [Saccharicrinis fermentans DSM 9555 = JCM 21142]